MLPYHFFIHSCHVSLFGMSVCSSNYLADISCAVGKIKTSAEISLFLKLGRFINCTRPENNDSSFEIRQAHSLLSWGPLICQTVFPAFQFAVFTFLFYFVLWLPYVRFADKFIWRFFKVILRQLQISEGKINVSVSNWFRIRISNDPTCLFNWRERLLYKFHTTYFVF